MTLTRNVGLKGLKYRGGGPMLVWVLHRIGGLAMIVFISIHVIASFFYQQTAGDFARLVDDIYESVYFQFFIIFVVYFHALNGLRIIILDIWPKLLEYQREATWLQWLIFIPLYGLTAVIMLMFKLQGG